ncbi:MAG: ATP-dependent Clp protease adaptor ClpS [Actinophytocola sp.]|uniref:ATP-dependent Clp protease adaptor ClpS n=1 Tax=Actinophytocola sp. TaxID=1872138 RepID=UPI003C7196AF
MLGRSICLVWRVSAHNDDVTSFEVVVYLLMTVCSFSFDDALAVTRRIERDGSVDVAAFDERGEAEALVVTLLRRGVHAMVRSA